MSLPAADIAYLSGLGVEYQVDAEAGMVCVLIRDWTLPPGFNHSEVDVLVRLSQGYPDIAPDMWWFSPSVHTAGGAALRNTNVYEHYLGLQWQRWSRHLTAEQWQSGVDGLENYFALIRNELQRSVLEPV